MKRWIDRSKDTLTHAQVELLNDRGDRRLEAYYFVFDSTGVEAIDLILAAIARAGKAYHSTESWDESTIYDDDDGASFVDLIQAAANSAAMGYPSVTDKEET